MWKGHLRLSPCLDPVELYSAVENAETISFNQIHKPSGNRIKYTKTVLGVGGVPAQEIVKGYAVDKNTYVLITHVLDILDPILRAAAEARRDELGLAESDHPSNRDPPDSSQDPSLRRSPGSAPRARCRAI